ncbi:MAG: DUF1415 domain-containing protein [Flavisolibacter sp.]
MFQDQIIIKETKNWITKIVIGCNFCPFASKVFINEKIHYKVVFSKKSSFILNELAFEMKRLDQNEDIETTILILPEGFKLFSHFLELLSAANYLVKALKMQKIYQLASFHPQYIFKGTAKNDPSNYTNRSPYPVIQILRENSITGVLAHFSKPENIPVKNIAYAREKGLFYMKELLQQCSIKDK